MNKRLFLVIVSVMLLSSAVLAVDYIDKYTNSNQQPYWAKENNAQNFQGRPPRPDMGNGKQGFQGRPPRPDMRNGGQGFQGRPPRPDMENGKQGFQGRPPRPDMRNGGQGFYGRPPKMNGYNNQGYKQRQDENHRF